MEPKSNYTKAFNYEMFIRNAFNCDRGMHGGDVAYMKNLLDAEDGVKLSYLSNMERKNSSLLKRKFFSGQRYVFKNGQSGSLYER